MNTGIAFSCRDFPTAVVQHACEKIANDPTGLLAAIIVALLIALVRPLRDWIWRLIKAAFFRLKVVWSATNRLNRARQSVANNGRGAWLGIARAEPSQYRLRMESAPGALPVITCANLKGGVGKTTMTGNLAARFARQKEKLVLAIDLDYQGSLSSMMFAGGKWQPEPEEMSLASMAIIGSHDSAWLCRAAQPATWVRNPESEKPEVRQVQNLKGIPAFHDLADSEDRLKLLWAIAEEKSDIRYFLYDLLHSDAFRNAFSMVFIDAPPRLTTACVQALVASTHVLIPTVMDDLSAGAVGYFGKQLRRHEELWPHLRVLGIVGSMRDGQKHERPALTAAGDALRQSLAGTKSKLNALQAAGIQFEFPYELSVPQRAALSRTAGKGIAYAALGDNKEGNDVRDIYNGLAEEIVQRMRA